MNQGRRRCGAFAPPPDFDLLVVLLNMQKCAILDPRWSNLKNSQGRRPVPDQCYLHLTLLAAIGAGPRLEDACRPDGS